MMTDDDEPQRSLNIFGRDVSKIPCFRNTFLYGISSGIGTGLVYFLFTSRAGMASHVGFGSFFGISLSYWFYCRYQWSKNRIAYAQIQNALQQATMYEGTELERKLKDRFEDVETTLDNKLASKLEEVKNVH